MAYKDFDDLSSQKIEADAPVTLGANGEVIDLPDASYVRDADMQRDGMDLVLNGPDGTIVIEGYFAAEPAPNLTAPGGETLTPQLVESFTHGSMEYATLGTATDESPVGSIQELTGEATVTRIDGTVESVQLGTPIYQGDVVATSADGAVNIVFIDETSFAISEDARLAIDEYVFDPATESGTTNFSVLKGLFVFTSGLIGRDDPDDVNIETPVGSIGIRGTIIMGDVNEGEITVVEGAIVLRGFDGTEVTLANQFETAKFSPAGNEIQVMGQLAAADVMSKFASMSDVSGDLFSSINDVANENAADDAAKGEAAGEEAQEAQDETQSEEESEGEAPAEAAPEGTTEGAEPAAEQAPEGPANDPALNGDGFGDNSGLGGEADIQIATDAPRGPAPGARGPAAGEPPAPGTGPLAGGAGNDPLADIPPPEVIGGANDGAVGPNPAFESDPFTFNVTNNVLDSGIPLDFFATASGATFRLNLGKVFGDPDISPNGDQLTFFVDETTRDNLNTLKVNGDIVGSTSIDFATGEISGADLFFTLDGNFNTDQTINDFTLFAVDRNGNRSGDFVADFQLFEENASGSTTLSSGNQTTVVDNNVTVTSTGGNKIFSGDSGNTISLLAGGNQVFAGDGNDTINISGASINGNTLMAGSGNDFFDIQDVENKFFGMDGDDTFFINANGNAAAVNDLDAGVTGSTTIEEIFHGGIGNDTVKFDTDGSGFSVDFSKFDNSLFQSIETLDFSSGNDENIALDFDSIFAMTDGDKHLRITLGDFDNLSISGTDEAPGAISTDQDVVLSDGTNQVTIFIDQQGTGSANFIT